MWEGDKPGDMMQGGGGNREDNHYRGKDTAFADLASDGSLRDKRAPRK